MPNDTPLALVTGASSGIGERVATRLALRGYRTLLVARRAGRLESLAARLSGAAPSTPVVLDLAEPARVQDVLESLAREHGDVNVLVNNAGFGRYGSFLEHSADDHRRLMEVHYFATIATIRAVLPAMVARRAGHVINIASMSTKVGPWGHSGYAAAKAAMVSLTQTLAAEHHDDGVRFSYVNPGIVDTDYFDGLGALGGLTRKWRISPDLVADRIVGLLDRPQLELCVPRHYRALDWIRALHPGLAHHLVRLKSRPPAP